MVVKKIYKYQLTIGGKHVKMQIGAEILSCQMQAGKLMLWALIDMQAQTDEERFFEVFGTGEEIPYDMGIDRNFIATVQESGFVWHVFERTDSL